MSVFSGKYRADIMSVFSGKYGADIMSVFSGKYRADICLFLVVSIGLTYVCF